MRDNGWNSSPGQDADTQPAMSSDFTYSNNAPHTGDLIRFGSSGYSLQLNSTYNNSTGRLSFRARNGDNSTWNIWREIWHDGNFNPASYLTTSGKAADSEAVDGVDSSRIVFGGNATKTTNVSSVSTALASGFYDGYNITGTPTSTWYTYINMRHNNTGNNYGSQIAVSFYSNADMYVRTISNGTYQGWSKIWNSANFDPASKEDAGAAAAVNDRIDSEVLAAIPTNNNQLTNGAGYITGVSWAAVTGKPSTFTPSAHTHSISDVTGLQTALDGKQAAGSYAASNHNHTYNVNDSWLRENGDNANVKLYGNTRQMVFRTDGTTEYASGVGGYAFAWMYGGDAAGNRRMLLGSDGRIWSSYHGWLDSAFASASHNHNSQYDALGSADAVNTRIETEVLPAIPTVPTNVSSFTNDAGYITDGNTNWNNSYGFIAKGDTQEPGGWTAATKFKSSGQIADADSGSHSLQLISDNNNDAFMSLHVSGDYAVFFGLDGATNRLHTGGWSAGATSYQIWDSRDFSSTNISNWNTAHGWGDHDGLYDTAGSAAAAAAGVDLRINEEVLPAIGAVTLASLGYTGATNANYITNNNQLTNGAGYLTSSNDRVYITDSRGAARAPSYYNDRYAQWDFQNTSDTGAGGDSWHALLTVSKWSSYDNSHKHEQLIFTGDNLKRRTATSDSTWGTIKTIWDTGNLGIGDGGLTEKNFTTALKNKLDGIAAGATNVTNNNQLTNGAGYATEAWADLAAFNYANIVNDRINNEVLPTIPTNNNQLGNGAGYVTSSHTHTPAQAGLGNLSASGNNLAGNFTATGDITAFSDARVKENIETIDNALDKVTQLRGVEYNKIGSEEKSIGVVAQEIREVLPEVVKENEDGMLSVAYGNITGVLIEAIKEQQKQIEELKAQLDGLTK